MDMRGFASLPLQSVTQGDTATAPADRPPGGGGGSQTPSEPIDTRDRFVDDDQITTFLSLNIKFHVMLPSGFAFSRRIRRLSDRTPLKTQFNHQAPHRFGSAPVVRPPRHSLYPAPFRTAVRLMLLFRVWCMQLFQADYSPYSPPGGGDWPIFSE